MSLPETYPQLLCRRAQENPGAIYLERVEGGQITYGDFYQQSLVWADALERVGVAANEQLAAMVPPGIDAALLFAGCGWRRARFTALNTAYRGDMLRHTLATAQPRVMVIASRYLPQLEGLDLADIGLHALVVLDEDQPAPRPGLAILGRGQFLAGAVARELDPPRPWDVASVIYTSGTTGPSKGVLVYWAQLHATAADATCDELTTADCWFAPLPMFHVSGQSSLYKSALAGCRMVVREVLSITDFFADIARFKVTGTVLLESMIGMITKQVEQGLVKPPSLRYLVLVPVPPGIDAFKALLGVRISTMYNMTEISGPLSSNGFNVDDSLARSCGRLRQGYQARVVDEYDYPLGPGQVGELVLRADSPWVMTGGYLNNPEATVAAWRNGWFHTGDLFRYDEAGRYYFVDRLKDSVRRRGENISSAEVENDINAHPAVAQCAVVAARNDQGDEEVKAFIVPRQGANPDPAEIIQFLRARLPHFMVPRYLEFIADLPRTPSQKIQKHLLRELGNSEKTWDRERAGIVIKREAP